MRLAPTLLVLVLLPAAPGLAAVSFVGGQLTPAPPPPKPAAMVVPWATPLADGPVRVLAVAPEYCKYDFVELAKRLDMEWGWVPASTRDRIAAPDAGESAILERLGDGLKNSPHVIVLANIDLAMLPQPWVEALTQRVRGGAGLLLAHVDGPVPPEWRGSLQTGSGSLVDDVVRGLGLTRAPEGDLIVEALYAGLCGEGRVVDFRTTEPLFFHSLLPPIVRPLLADEVYRETYLALFARAVLWAAAFEPDVQIAALASTAVKGPAEEEIPPDLPPEFIQAMKDSLIQPLLHPFVLRLNQAAPQRYGVRAQIRIPGRDLHLVWPQERFLEKGQTAYAFSLPVPVGNYFLDVWLLDPGRNERVVDWHSEAVTVAGWPAITAFQASRAAVMPNDTLELTIVVPPQLRRMEEAMLAGEVVVRATDNLGRLVAEKSSPLSGEGGRFVFDLDLVGLPGNRLKLEAFAADRRGAAMASGSLFNTAYDYTYLPVAAPTGRPYTLIVEGTDAVEYNAARLMDILRKHGVDAIAGADSVDFALLASHEDMRVLPGFHVPAVLEKEAEACPQDGAHWHDTLETMQENVRAYATVGAQTFLVAAPEASGHSSQACWPCRRALQEYLHAQYSALADLNAAWNTSYTRWEDLTFAASPGTPESWAPYVDIQRYHERILADPYMLSQAAIQEVAPHARVGAVLPAQVSTGTLHDLWLFASQLNALVINEDPVAAEKIRSYRSAESFTAVKHRAPALVKSASLARWLPWHGIAHGMSATWIADALGGAGHAPGKALLTPDLKPQPALVDIAAQMDEVQGTTRVLAAATRESYGIAIYDSPASGHVNHVMNGWYETRADAEAAIIDILEPLGYQYDFVADAAAVRGALSEYRVLFMPAVWAMSDQEAAGIRAFHEGGGIVIVDGLPAIYDEHGRLRAESPLAPLFGVGHTGGRSYIEASDHPVALTLGDRAFETTLTHAAVDGSVGGGEAADGPVIWKLHHAPAPALLLNHALDGATRAQARAAVEFLLRQQGFMPVAQPQLRKGRAFDGEVVHWRLGAASIAMLLRDPGPGGNQKVSPNLRLDGHVYNMRSGEHIRKPGKLTVGMRPGDAALFCALPYEVTRLELKPASNDAAAGRPLRFAVEINTKGGLPGRHLVWVDLIGPDAQPLRHYGQPVWCDAGRGHAGIPLALNEKPGAYTLRARDVLSGVTAAHPVQVLP